VASLDLLSKYLQITELRFDAMLYSLTVRKILMRAYQMFTRAAFSPQAAGAPALIFCFCNAFLTKHWKDFFW